MRPETEEYKRGDLQIVKRSTGKNPLKRVIEITAIQHGVVLKLNDLLPEGWVIVEGNYPVSFSDRKEIHVPGNNFLQKDFSIYKTLHEFGHAHDEDHNSEANNPFTRNLLRALQRDGKLAYMPDDLLDEYVQTVLQNERRAHAWALKTLRRLSSAIDLEPGISSEQLRKEMHKSLDTYTKSGSKQVISRRGKRLVAQQEEYSYSLFDIAMMIKNGLTNLYKLLREKVSPEKRLEPPNE